MHRHIAAFAVILTAGLAGCSQTHLSTQEVAQACQQIQNQLDTADSDFVAHVREIRNEHILLIDYDRKMIGALTGYRNKVRAILDEQENGRGSIHCIGDQLTEVEHNESPRLRRVGSYLIDFERALKQDPPNAYVE
ncbi:MAG TPA: hypothetical protein VML19_07250 [Verrucomicrobiae bacterium]|nr:hypothetical protein [Verrucomicrobiae bacterium]